MKRIIIALATISMVFGFVSATLASDWSFYGSSRVSTFWTTQNKNLTGTNFDRSSLDWGLQGNSRIGAHVKVNDNLTGGFEYGTGVNVRLLYGEYNFGGFKMLVGQAYTPINVFYSNQVFGTDNDMLDCGMPYDGRQPMIRISTQGFELAFVSPHTSGDVYGLPASYSTTKVEIPKIEASYTFAVQNFTFFPYAGYQTYKAVDDSGTTKNESTIDSWVAGLGIQGAFGPFYANVNGFVAQNQGNFGLASGWSGTTNSTLFASYNPATGSISDNSTWGGGVVAGYHINDIVSLEAGYALLSGQVKVSSIKTTQETQEYYIQAPITLAKNVVFTAEAGVMDGGTIKTTGLQNDKVGTNSYIGGKWQINF